MRLMSPETAPARQAGSFPRSLTIFGYRGVPVRLHWSWTIIAALVAFFLYERASAQLGTGDAVIAALATTVLFFASILVHELGHCHTSLDRGLPVTGVTLFWAGGVTQSTREAASARDDLIIVGAGPFLSFTLAAGFGLAHSLGPDAQPFAWIVGISAWLNLALAVFNVLPGFPMDGGRLLRALLWAVTRRPHAATRWAARVGQLFALGLAALGLRGMIGGDDGEFGGVWLLLIALLLFRGAADAHRQARFRERYTGRLVRDVMGTVPEPLDPDQPVHLAVRLVDAKPSLLWPVGDPVIGAVRKADLEQVDRSRWALTTLGEVVAPLTKMTVPVDAPMDVALARMAEAPGNMIVVVDDEGRAAGLLTPSLVVDEPR